MDSNGVIDGLIQYLGLVALLTCHEFGHAWMAWKCGDDTARLHGRVTLNPMAHIDILGTVILPLAAIFLTLGGSSLGRFIIGWAKPVPVNFYNLRNPRVDDILVTLAGPWMNLLLAVILMALAKVGVIGHYPEMVQLCIQMAYLSLMLCFFNLIPIPPLDGSQVARSLTGMSLEAYNQIARYGVIILIIILQIPFVRQLLGLVSMRALLIIAGWFGVPMDF